jgi:cobalt/nickel transport system ATP-binding protein
MINIAGVSYRYADGTLALSDVSLDVKDGEVLALMGANGCGKTTLLKLLLGLLKPSLGTSTLSGRDLRTLRPEEIFRQVGMVFQDPNDQLFAATAEQDVAVGVVNLGLDKAQCADRTGKALGMVDALELAGRPIHALSFGQKRRIAIAGVLAMEPRTMLLDEPTSGLDPRSVNSVMSLLRALNRDLGVSMVIATHDADMVPLFCDRVAILSKGKIIAAGEPKQVFAHVDEIRAAGLRLPRIAHLMEILRKEDGLGESDLPLTIGEARKELKELIFLKGRGTMGSAQHGAAGTW